MSKSKFLLTFLLMTIAHVVMAQGIVISGTVEDAMGPVMMANVVERDGNNRIVNATQTDMMGNFSMEIKNPKNKLVVSYVGSKPFTATIGDKTTFQIKLEDEKTTLSEITVRGRRTTAGGLNIDKREISVSQQTFNLQDVEGMAFTSADEALQGEIAGLDIVSNSGNLGSGSQMRLRGVSTMSGNANPLIVVDDKIFEYEDFDVENADPEAFSSLLAVSVDDIASISVLKDAAATAIWGNQGANGVIQITTKRGNRGKPKVSLGYKFTGTWMPAGYTLLNGDQYTMMMKEELYNPVQNSSATSSINEINYVQNSVDSGKGWKDYYNWDKNTDWVKEVKQFGQQHEVNFNISGGGQKATFRISAGYNDQTGTIIKQKLQRLTTRLVLDYNVSDRIRFSTNFALTYTDNLKNYTTNSSKDNKSHNNILPMALAMAPNASVYRYDEFGNLTDEFFQLMRPAPNSNIVPSTSNVTSYSLAAVTGVGNPVATANLSWQKEKTYSIVPDFNVKYELLGTTNDKHRLTFNGRVYFDIYAYSKPTFMPGSLLFDTYNDPRYDQFTNAETNQFKMGARAEMIFTPHFNNEDFSLTMLARYEAITQKNSYQFVSQGQIPDGIMSSTVVARQLSMSNQPSSMKWASQNFVYNAHFSYKSRYNASFSLRGDGSSAFGPDSPWFLSPSVSLRYNVSEEKFFQPLKKYVSMLGLRASWGITGSMGKVSVADYFNSYSSRVGRYGDAYYTSMSGLKLDNIKPQKKQGLNFGVNLGILDDMVEFDLNIYKENTKDLIMEYIPIPGISAWGTKKTETTQRYGNVGELENKGWELNVTGNKFLKIKKFSVSASFNMAQNINKLKSMDERVLKNNMNSEPVFSDRGRSSIISHVVVGEPMSSIYGYQCNGVYTHTYEFMQNYNTQQKQLYGANWTTADYENWINDRIAAGYTFPVATDQNGKVIMDNGTPKRLTYWYGKTEYSFQGGDAIYQDVNHDGTINQLDMMYLGNSLPKMQGGFSLTLQYAQWKLVARFNYRWGNKIINTARMSLEAMSGTDNQAASVTYRWRKDGDETLIPRALYGNSYYNYQMSSRFVEDGSFLRFQNMQISYSFPKKKIKKLGLSSLSAYFTMNNLFCWTKYSGIDPEVSAGTYQPAIDGATTPKAKSFTASLNFGF